MLPFWSQSFSILATDFYLVFHVEAPWIADILYASLCHVPDFLFSTAVGNFSFDTFANSDQTHSALPLSLCLFLLSVPHPVIYLFLFFGHAYVYFDGWCLTDREHAICILKSQPNLVWQFSQFLHPKSFTVGLLYLLVVNCFFMVYIW